MGRRDMSTPGKVSNRQIRKAVNNQLGIRFEIAPNIPIEDGIHAVRMLQGAVVEAHRETLRALVNDELKTRGRVDALEAFRDMTFTQRLRWLIRGYN